MMTIAAETGETILAICRAQSQLEFGEILKLNTEFLCLRVLHIHSAVEIDPSICASYVVKTSRRSWLYSRVSELQAVKEINRKISKVLFLTATDSEA